MAGFQNLPFYFLTDGHFEEPLFQLFVAQKRTDGQENTLKNQYGYSYFCVLFSKTASRRSQLNQVHIPDGVISIDHSAFAMCTALEDVSLPSSLTIIGQRRFFWGCGNIDKIVDAMDGPLPLVSMGLKAVTLICSKDSYAFQYAQNYDIAVETKLRCLHGARNPCRYYSQGR